MILRAVLFWLLAGTAYAASPTIDGSGTGIDYANSPGAHTSVSATLTTSSSPDIIVCAVAISNTAGSANTLSGCSGTALAFTLRKRYPNEMGSNCAILDVNPCNLNVEVWEAIAAAPFSGTITANYSAPLCPSGVNNGCRASLVAFGVTGVISTPSPHDPNLSLPNTNFSAPDRLLESGMYTTTNANDLLIWYFGSAARGQAGCLGTSYPVSPLFTLVASSAFPSSNCMAVAYLSVSSTVNRAYSVSDGAAWGIIGDAFTADFTPVPPPVTSGYPNTWVHE